MNTSVIDTEQIKNPCVSVHFRLRENLTRVQEAVLFLRSEVSLVLFLKSTDEQHRLSEAQEDCPRHSDSKTQQNAQEHS